MSKKNSVKIWAEFFLEIVQLAIVHNVLKYKDFDHEHDVKQKCGIPIVDWINIFVFAVIIKAFAGIFKIYVLEASPKSLQYVDFLKTFIIDGILLAWIAYGSALFWS